MTEQAWTIGQLWSELRRFEDELNAAKLAENTVRTYVDRTTFFLRFLVGDYTPEGPRR